MAWGYFDLNDKRYWLSDGNVRTARELADGIADKAYKPELLINHLARNAVSVSTIVENTFKHPFEQYFPAEQVPVYDGVPPSEADVAETAKAQLPKGSSK